MSRLIACPRLLTATKATKEYFYSQGSFTAVVNMMPWLAGLFCYLTALFRRPHIISRQPSALSPP